MDGRKQQHLCSCGGAEQGDGAAAHILPPDRELYPDTESSSNNSIWKQATNPFSWWQSPLPGYPGSAQVANTYGTTATSAPTQTLGGNVWPTTSSLADWSRLETTNRRGDNPEDCNCGVNVAEMIDELAFFDDE